MVFARLLDNTFTYQLQIRCVNFSGKGEGCFRNCHMWPPGIATVEFRLHNAFTSWLPTWCVDWCRKEEGYFRNWALGGIVCGHQVEPSVISFCPTMLSPIDFKLCVLIGLGKGKAAFETGHQWALYADLSLNHSLNLSLILVTFVMLRMQNPTRVWRWRNYHL